MTTTYPGTLVDGRIEWGPAGPPPLPAGTPVSVQVTVFGATESDGPAMATALAAIAAVNGAECFGDPVEWQRETRKDRPLPWDDQ